MQPIVLLGHLHQCPLHGTGTVTSGAGSFLVNGTPVARVGDLTRCGAVINSGSATCHIEGQPIARVGDTTDHGGSLIEGDESWLVE